MDLKNLMTGANPQSLMLEQTRGLKAKWEKTGLLEGAGSETSKKLTPAQKSAAKAKAKAAGRPYPNLIDNAAVAKKSKKK